jgi:putative spermidine/putrescine transport system permease protein
MLLDFAKLGAWRWVLYAITLLMSLFLLLPIVFIVALSFGESRWLIFPPPGWTLRWYHDLFADPRWLKSALISAKIGVIVMIASVVLGFLASLALVRGKFRGQGILRAFFLTPMVLPVIILAVALYAFFLRLGINGTLPGFVLAHLIVALPFSIITISSALESFDPAIEDAAILCGASPWEARAVRIWTTLRQDLTPVIAAASSLLVGLTIVLMILVALIRKGRKR